MVGIEECGSGVYDGVSPIISADQIMAEYRQMAHAQFRRIYYDLSRGIRLPDDGVNYLFKYATSDISTSTYGMYGEIRTSCLQRICKEMERFGLDKRSVVLDLGSGRGVPSFLFAHQVPVFASVGIEMCPVSYESSVHNLLHFLKLDVTRCICETTNFGSTSNDELHTGGMYVGSDDCGGIRGICDDALRTPTNTRLGNNTEDESNSKTVMKPDVTESVETRYDSHTREADETCETPVKDSDDDSTYYRTLHRFSRAPSSLGVGFCNEDISAFDHYNGATHIYSFDIAMEKALVNNIVRQFTNTKTAWLFASYNSDLLERFELKGCFLAAKIPCQMYKSGENRCCYIYVKNDWESIKREYDAVMSRFIDEKPSAASTSLDLNSYRALIDAIPQTPRKATVANTKLGYNLRGRCKRSIPSKCKDEPRVDQLEIKSELSNDILLSQFNEPVDLIELIKLAKMPLGAQIGWYVKKATRSGIMMTRSKRLNGVSQLKRSLCAYRSKILEMIATASDTATSKKYVSMLQHHINQMYMPVHSFPNPPTWL